MKRAALYARISQTDTRVPAIKNQLVTLQRLADSEGYEVVGTYSDDGISAYKGKVRPGYLDLLKGIAAREFDVVLAVAEDRLTRSSEEKVGLQSLCVRNGITWHTSASGRVDPATAEGGLLATITGAIAQYESQLKQERLLRSVSDRLDAGKDLGGPRPFGFEKDRRTIREHEAEVLRTAYAMVLKGSTLWAVANMFRDSGITRDRSKDSAWRTQTVRAILLRDRNRGRLVVKGVTYESDLPSIIDDASFEQVKSILENPARAPRRGPKPTTFVSIGTVRCGVCNSFVSQSGARGDGSRQIRCSPHGRPSGFEGMTHPSIRADKLETQIRTAVFTQLITAPKGTTVDLERTAVVELTARLAEAVRQRDIAQELIFAPGANVAVAQKKLADLGRVIDDTQSELDQALNADVATVAIATAKDSMDDALALAKDTGTEQLPTGFIQYWDGLSLEQRKLLVTATLPELVLLPAKSRHPEDWRISHG